MRYTEPDEPQSQPALPETAEDRLRRENQELRRQLQDLKTSASNAHHAPSANVWHPSRITTWSIVLGVLVLTTIAFLAGYIPLQTRKAVIASEAREQEQALPRVDVIQVARSTQN